jgi:hypothetical protein
MGQPSDSEVCRISIVSPTYQDIVLTESGQRNLDNAVDLRLLISESLHGLRKIGTHCD